MLTRAHGTSATVDGNSLSRDEGRLVWRQEGNSASDFVNRAHPAHGMGSLAVFQELLVGFVRHATAFMNLRDDYTGVDSVDCKKKSKGLITMQEWVFGFLLFFFEMVT